MNVRIATFAAAHLPNKLQLNASDTLQNNSFVIADHFPLTAQSCELLFITRHLNTQNQQSKTSIKKL
jgi:hypothetical protein